MRTSYWYYRHGTLGVEACASEEEAFFDAYYGEQDGQCSLVGFSYEDGSAVKAGADLKYLAFCKERDALEQARYAERAKQPPPKMITLPVPAALGLKMTSVVQVEGDFDPEDLAYLLPLNT